MQDDYTYEPLLKDDHAEEYVLRVLPGTLMAGSCLATLNPLQTRAPEQIIAYSDSDSDDDSD